LYELSEVNQSHLFAAASQNVNKRGQFILANLYSIADKFIVPDNQDNSNNKGDLIYLK
jgi:hypothetical protein